MLCKGVLFDMDGLLLDTERAALTGFESAARDLGLGGLAPLGRTLIGLRADAVERRLRAALNGPVTFETFDAAWRAHFRAALADGIPLKPGAARLLAQLADAGLPCAVATSTRTANARRHLQEAGIARYFQAVIGGDRVTRGKPAPDIYHEAAASLGLAATDCIAFEDSDPGTAAALAAGARVVQVPDLVAPSPHMANRGQIIAETLLEGARRVGLIDARP